MDLEGDFLGVHGAQDIAGDGWEKGQDCESAVFLILLEPTSQTGVVIGGEQNERQEMRCIKRENVSYFSFAMRSLLMRSRASLILFRTYWVAMYPAPTMPTPMAIGVRLLRSQRRADENMSDKGGRAVEEIGRRKVVIDP